MTLCRGRKMIWRRLKKSTREQEEEFSERLSEEKLSAFLVIVLPCIAILVGLSLLVMFLFGVLLLV